MTHRPRLIIVLVIFACLCVAAFMAGAIRFLGAVGTLEWGMIGALVAYFLFGVRLCWRGDWHKVGFIANGLPVYALVFTTLGIVGAAAHGIDQSHMAETFNQMLLALVPNAVGTFLMQVLRELAWRSAEEEV